MAKPQNTKNHIKSICKQRVVSAVELAKKIGTSAPHMSRLINGQSPLSHEWLLKISKALKVPTSQIVGLEVDIKGAAACDDTLLGSVMGWVLEASEAFDIELTRKQMTKLTGFVYREAVQRRLTLDEIRSLAFSAVKIKRLLE